MSSEVLATAPMPLAAVPEALRRAGNEVSEDIFDAIVALGAAAIPPLLALVRQADDSNDWLAPAPWHALTLLGHVADESALDGLIDLLHGLVPDDFELVDAVTPALVRIGPAAMPPLLELLEEVVAEEDGFDVPEFVAGLLVRLGCRDERLFSVLLQLLRDYDPVLGAGLLADFGDARAVPPLSRMLDDLAFEPSDLTLLSNMAIVEVADAIERLGGVLTPPQDDKLAVVVAARRRIAAAVRKRGTGRNDPCWCGSTRKYKKCCLQNDEAM